MTLARRLCVRRGVELPSQDLAFLPAGTPEAEQYRAAMTFALEFARANRERMMGVVARVVCGRTGCRGELRFLTPPPQPRA